LEKPKDRRPEWSRKKREQGLCRTCGILEVAPTSKHYCDACLYDHLVYQKARIERLRSEGRCIQCGGPNDTGTRLCEEHRIRHRERQRARYHARKHGTEQGS
jgi:hypothetical protein